MYTPAPDREEFTPYEKRNETRELQRQGIEHRMYLLPTTFGPKRRKRPYQAQQRIPHDPLTKSETAIQFVFGKELSTQALQDAVRDVYRRERLLLVPREPKPELPPQTMSFEIRDLSIKRPVIPADVTLFYGRTRFDKNTMMCYSSQQLLQEPYSFRFDRNLAVELLKRCDVDTILVMSQLNKWWNDICQHENIWKEQWKYRASVGELLKYYQGSFWNDPSIQFMIEEPAVADRPDWYKAMVRKQYAALGGAGAARLKTEPVNAFFSSNREYADPFDDSETRAANALVIPQSVSRERSKDIFVFAWIAFFWLLISATGTAK